MSQHIEQPLSEKEFQHQLGIDKAAMDRLLCYAEMLRTWQARINLVSTSSLNDIWRRHMLDSAQLKKFIRPSDQTILDLGSGAGFPGLVLGIITGLPIHLVESNNKKCSFLREVARKTDTNVVIHQDRIESLNAFSADIITSRALAPLENLIAYSAEFLAENSRCLFLKGAKGGQELTQARKKWNMIVTEAESLSDASGVIYLIEGIHRRHV
jgi:16S rRNA (guanine527-N7)-methyltransferase